jgi:hypothetical protein
MFVMGVLSVEFAPLVLLRAHIDQNLEGRLGSYLQISNIKDDFRSHLVFTQNDVKCWTDILGKCLRKKIEKGLETPASLSSRPYASSS